MYWLYLINKKTQEETYREINENYLNNTGAWDLFCLIMDMKKEVDLFQPPKKKYEKKN